VTIPYKYKQEEGREEGRRRRRRWKDDDDDDDGRNSQFFLALLVRGMDGYISKRLRRSIDRSEIAAH